LPNQVWQSDFTHWELANGRDVEILNWLDDRRVWTATAPAGAGLAAAREVRWIPRIWAAAWTCAARSGLCRRIRPRDLVDFLLSHPKS
jgi:hypothetical protein